MDSTVIGLGICIVGVIVIAVIKYREMKYNYKAMASVLLQELLVKKHGMKNDLANKVCTEIYNVKKVDFDNSSSVAQQGAERLNDIFNNDNIKKMVIEEAQKMNIDYNDSGEFNRVKEIVLEKLLAQLTNRKIKNKK